MIGQPSPTTNLGGRRCVLGQFTSDDKYIYFLWGEDLGDIWVMELAMDESA